MKESNILHEFNQTIDLFLDKITYNTTPKINWAIYIPIHFKSELGQLNDPLFYSLEAESPFIAPHPSFYIENPQSLHPLN